MICGAAGVAIAMTFFLPITFQFTPCVQNVTTLTQNENNTINCTNKSGFGRNGTNFISLTNDTKIHPNIDHNKTYIESNTNNTFLNSSRSIAESGINSDANATNSSLDLMINNTDTPIVIIPTEMKTSTGKLIDITKMTLQEVCTLYRIPKVACKCPGLGKICEVIKIINEKADTITCEKSIFTQATVMLIICVIGLFGNVIVLHITAVNWKNSASCHKLIGALALSDFIFLLFQMAYDLPFLWRCTWAYGRILCKIIPPCITITASTALGFILIISTERFVGILFPFSRGLKSKSIHIMSVVNVLLSILMTVPIIYVLDVSNVNQCVEHWNDPEYSKIYSWLFFVLTFLLPIIAIATMYVIMVRSLKKKQKMNFTASTNDIHRARRKNENQKIVLIVASLLIAFTVLVSPNRIFWVLKDQGIINQEQKSENLSYYQFAATVPYILHAVINPLIYSIVDRKFRASLKKMFSRRSNKSTMEGALSSMTIRTSTM